MGQTLKRTALSALMGGETPTTVHPIGKPTKRPATVVSSPARRATKLVQSDFRVSVPVQFTEDDHLIIDFVDEKGTVSHGEFYSKVKERPACWTLTYRIRTIPAAYFADQTLTKETMSTIDSQYDEFELIYNHQSYCEYTELNRIVKDILVLFLDPKTYLLAAQVKIQPMNLTEFLRINGPFQPANTADGDYDIDYWFDPLHSQNYDFVERPLTSSTVPYKPAR